MRLKEICFILENCETITIAGKHVGDFMIEDIRTSLRRCAINATRKMEVCNHFYIEICKDANCKNKPFGCEDIDSNDIFTRLKLGDITSVEVILEDADNLEDTETYNYYVRWTGDSDYYNESQEVWISNIGNLYICISEEKHLGDFLDKEEKNEEEYMRGHFLYM